MAFNHTGVKTTVSNKLLKLSGVPKGQWPLVLLQNVVHSSLYLSLRFINNVTNSQVNRLLGALALCPLAYSQRCRNYSLFNTTELDNHNWILFHNHLLLCDNQYWYKHSISKYKLQSEKVRLELPTTVTLNHFYFSKKINLIQTVIKPLLQALCLFSITNLFY